MPGFVLARLLLKQRNFEEAEPLYRRALAIYEVAYGAEHPDTIALLDEQRSMATKL